MTSIGSIALERPCSLSLNPSVAADAASTSRSNSVYQLGRVGLQARAGVSQYAATKHALKAIADSLREEVNADGIPRSERVPWTYCHTTARRPFFR